MTWGSRIKFFMYGVLIAVIVAFAWEATAQEAANDVIYTDSTTNSTVTTNGEMTTNVNSPPPSAISPTFNGGVNSDLCTVGVAGAVQTQILGISMGQTVRDMNCEKLKNAKTLYDMGMKVAAVSVMCQDERVFDAMMDAGTPCPYDGMIGGDAKAAWDADPDRKPGAEKKEVLNDSTKTLMGTGGVLGILALLLFL
jgi:hypothetical protein